MGELQHLLKGVVDEDKADEGGEALLGEAGEILHQEAGVRGHQHQAEHPRPQPDPQPELQVVKAVGPARRERAQTMLKGGVGTPSPTTGFNL